MSLLSVSRQERQGKERGGIRVCNISAHPVAITAFVGQRELDWQSLGPQEQWFIGRSLKSGTWVLAVGGANYKRPLTLRCLSSVGASEEWQLTPDGPITKVSADPNHVFSIFQTFDRDGDGFISKLDLARVLQSLTQQINAADVDRMVFQADANRDGFVDYEQLLGWLFADRYRYAVCRQAYHEATIDERLRTADIQQPPRSDAPPESVPLQAAQDVRSSKAPPTDCVSGSKSDWSQTDSPAATAGTSSKTLVRSAHDPEMDGDLPEEPTNYAVGFPTTITVTVEWLAADSSCTRAPLHDVPWVCTLADLKRRCASLLSVSDVRPKDYNEDMDELRLCDLGIGLSGLPFAVELGEALPDVPLDSRMTGGGGSLICAH